MAWTPARACSDCSARAGDARIMPALMSVETKAGFAALRRLQLAGWTTLFGIFTCFLTLVAVESRAPARARAVEIALGICLIAHLCTVVYLRTKRCPACGHKFIGATRSVLGSFTAMSQRTCQHCGAGPG
jgi:hypothetical protein